LLDLRNFRDNLYEGSLLRILLQSIYPLKLEYTEREMEVGKHIRSYGRYFIGGGDKEHPLQVAALVFLIRIV
jgi:hypothetical protein